MNRVSLVLLCGIPGSGKTHLSNTIKQYFTRNLTRINVLVIHYDDIISWIRPDSKNDVNSLYVSLVSDDASREDYLCWKDGRHLILDALTDILTDILHGKLDEEADGQSKHIGNVKSLIMKNMQYYKADQGGTFEKSTDYIIILDDNMYYRSMRYEYYQLARKTQVSFCILHTNCVVGTALHRNASRESQVPEEIILSMAQRIEVPDGGKNTWEINTYTVDTDKLSASEDINGVIEFILHSLDNPLQQIKDNSEMQESSRQENLKSFIHQADIELRRIVSERICQEKVKGELNIRTFARRLNRTRQQILNDLRKGNIDLHGEFVDNLSQIMEMYMSTQGHS